MPDDDCIVEYEDCPFLLLPEELIIYICTFLDTKTVICGLSEVCKRFNNILNSDTVFKSRFATRWRKPYLTAHTINNISWASKCIYLEKNYTDAAGTKIYLENATAHIASVDAVLFVRNGELLFTGARDRSIVAWKFNLDSNNVTTPETLDCSKIAHDGWVWRFCSFGDYVYSASWDCFIKQWDYTEKFVEKDAFLCEGPVLCISGADCQLIFGGTLNKTVSSFDPRAGNDSQWSFKAHNQAILNIACLGNDLVTSCEDGTVAVWDIRSQKELQKCRLKNDTYGICSQVVNNELFIADNRGFVNIFGRKDGQITCCDVVQMQNDYILGMRVNEGSIWTAGRDGSLKGHLRLSPPVEVWNYSRIPSNASGIDYCNGKLAVGYHNKVTFWLPPNAAAEEETTPCIAPLTLSD